MTDFPNWFDITAKDNFEQFLTPLAQYEALQLLQIGAFTGDASLWLVKSLCNDPFTRLDDVDTWAGSDERAHEEMDFAEVERVYDEKTAPWRETGQLDKYKTTSDDFFKNAPASLKYNFIYIDGDHTARQVIKDAINAHYHLEVGGIIAFDDYTWDSGRGELENPKPAIDAFFYLHNNKYELLARNSQVWLRRTAL